jgi:predicted secreted acid phosphatase
MPTVCIIDIDTTLANNDHRAALLERDADGHITQESWDAFLQPELLALDQPQKHAKDVIEYMRNHGYMIVFLTGRNEKYYEPTRAWLTAHMGLLPGKEPLVMRGLSQVGLPASKAKQEIFINFVEKNKLHNCSFLFFEDDKHVLPMWKKFGLVFKCPEAWEHMNPDMPKSQEFSWAR